MKRSFVVTALCLAASLLVSGPVAAKKAQMQNIDFGTITCGAFLKELSTSTAEDAGVVLMWIDGYLSGVSGDTDLDWGNLEKFSKDLVEYCGNNSNTKVLEAAKKVGIE
jgi:acid stress chaperone HdeB